MKINTTRAAGGFAFLLVACAAALGLAAPAQAFESRHTLFQGEPSSMGQVNGPVFATEIVGGRIYVGGKFTAMRPAGAAAGTSETPVSNIAAFDAVTGAPITSFHPVLRNNWSGAPGIVSSMAVSPDGKTLYVGGDFNEVDGLTSEHTASFDAATGAWKGMIGWNGANGNVQALAVTPDGKTIYVGGAFNQMSWQTRNDLGAIDLTTGGPTSFAPKLTNNVQNYPVEVLGLGVSTDGKRVFAAGPFRTSNGQSTQGFAAFDSTGANVPGFTNYFYAPYSFGTSIDVSGNTVYSGGRDDITSTLARTEGVFSINATSGAKNWYANCYGDTFAVLAVGNDVYAGSHSHDCSANGGVGEGTSRNYLGIHAVDKTTGTEVPYFVQTEGNASNQDTLLDSRSLSSDGSQLVMGGGFLSVNGQSQTNLTRFKLGSSAPERAPWPQATASTTTSTVSISVLETLDRDDVNLTYKVYRDWNTAATPVATYTQPTLPWPSASFTVTDTGAAPGTQHYYTVVVTDPAGNSVTSVRSNTVTVHAAAKVTPKVAKATPAQPSSTAPTGGPTTTPTSTPTQPPTTTPTAPTGSPTGSTTNAPTKDPTPTAPPVATGTGAEKP